MSFLTDIFIYSKRMLRHFGIVLLLLCLPVLAIMFRNFANKAEGAYVGIYAESNADEITSELLKNKDAINFKIYSSKDQMINDVETQILECGFILPENVSDIENMQMICGEGYASVLSEVSKEAVFAAVLKVYGDKAALSFAKKSNIDINDENFKTAYLKYAESTPASVTFDEAPANIGETAAKKNIPLCIAAAMLICAGLIGAAFYMGDKKQGIRFGAGKCIAVALLLFSASAAAALMILGQKPDFLRLAVFCAGIWGGSCIFAAFVNNEMIARLIMPVVLMAVFLFDIVGVSDILPQLKIVDNMLLSHYFIYENIVRLTGISGILCVIGWKFI